MPVPDFVLALRRQVGHARLPLTGVCAVVVRTDRGGPEVLYGRRSDNGRWALPSGIVEPQEQPATTVVREVLEELCVEVEPERLGAFHQGAQVGVAAQEVVDQFAAQRLFPADQVSARVRVAFGEPGDREVDNVQHRGGGGAHRLAFAGAHRQRQVLPQPPRRRQVQLNHPPGGDTLFRGPPAEQTHRLQLAARSPPPRRTALGLRAGPRARRIAAGRLRA